MRDDDRETTAAHDVMRAFETLIEKIAWDDPRRQIYQKLLDLFMRDYGPPPPPGRVLAFRPIGAPDAAA
jgi:hypothetical protein